MGSRGPVTGSTFGRKPGPEASSQRQPDRRRAPSRALDPLAPIVEAPSPPADLPAGTETLWATVWAAMPVGVLSDLDCYTIRRLCDLVAERLLWVEVLAEHGPLLREVVQNARGDIIGHRWVSNPAAKELRQLDRAIDAVSDRLGLSPSARARLGLTINQAKLASAHALMAGMRRKGASA